MVVSRGWKLSPGEDDLEVKTRTLPTGKREKGILGTQRHRGCPVQRLPPQCVWPRQWAWEKRSGNWEGEDAKEPARKPLIHSKSLELHPVHSEQ